MNSGLQALLSLAPTPPFQRDFFHNVPLSKYILCLLLLLPFSLLSTSYDRSLFKVGSIDIPCSVFSHQSMIVLPLFYLMEVPYPQTEVPKSVFQWSHASLADCTVLQGVKTVSGLLTIFPTTQCLVHREYTKKKNTFFWVKC